MFPDKYIFHTFHSPQHTCVKGNTRDVAEGAVETVVYIELDYCTCALENKISDRCLTVKKKKF